MKIVIGTVCSLLLLVAPGGVRLARGQSPSKSQDVIPVGFCADQSATHLFDANGTLIRAEYGQRTAMSIDVGVVGPGVERSGLYHLPSGTRLLELVTEAGASKVSNGQFLVNRHRQVVLRADLKSDPDLGNYRLQPGDVVFAGERLL